MMRGHPALLSFVVLEHGKVRHPEETVVFCGVAALFENAVAVGVLLR